MEVLSPETPTWDLFAPILVQQLTINVPSQPSRGSPNMGPEPLFSLAETIMKPFW
jgi:hypothetical protein